VIPDPTLADAPVFLEAALRIFLVGTAAVVRATLSIAGDWLAL
jgi:hypothetical protein